MARTIFALVLLSGAANVPASGIPPYPFEVEEFVDRRELCDHFRGEEPYDGERAEFLEKQIRETCTGTDQELRALKEKYKDDAEVMKVLNRFEEDIEAKSPTDRKPDS